MAPSQKKTEDPKEVAGIWGLYTIITKNNKLEKSDKKKEKRFRLWGRKTVGRQIYKNTNGKEELSVRFFMIPWVPISGLMKSPVYVNKGRAEWRAIFKSVASQLPSTQNNPSTELVYFRMMYSDSLQPYQGYLLTSWNLSIILCRREWNLLWLLGDKCLLPKAFTGHCPHVKAFEKMLLCT